MSVTYEVAKAAFFEELNELEAILGAEPWAKPLEEAYRAINRETSWSRTFDYDVIHFINDRLERSMHEWIIGMASAVGHAAKAYDALENYWSDESNL